ncbi:MAG: hypothetical protein AAF215_06395 [Cyanobacteria bacterium P01_A01_bin.123]
MYFNPPFVLVAAGLLSAIAAGAAFSATLQQGVKDWAANRSTQTLANLQGLSLMVPFIGICIGTCVFLSSGISLFGVPDKISYAFGLPMTLLIGLLVWVQLGRNLKTLEEGGSEALDLDVFN